ncbi:MAG TPA: hypothetical protein VJP84_06030, partial [Steroidobacteraceae bacterium]|nr:hypothetical protein [Steroidobacteraceae bacterium]
MQPNASILPAESVGDMRTRMSIALLATVVTQVCILLVNPTSMAHFAWYFCVWNAFVLLLHREWSGQFAFAFLVNSAFVGIFVLVQSTVFPDSYGTTSPLAVSWTDDSFFFT